MWESEDEFWKFLNYAKTAKTISGVVTGNSNYLACYIVLIEYEGIYYVQVEVEDIHGDIVARLYSSDNYQACLQFVIAVSNRG